MGKRRNAEMGEPRVAISDLRYQSSGGRGLKCHYVGLNIGDSFEALDKCRLANGITRWVGQTRSTLSPLRGLLLIGRTVFPGLRPGLFSVALLGLAGIGDLRLSISRERHKGNEGRRHGGGRRLKIPSRLRTSVDWSCALRRARPFAGLTRLRYAPCGAIGRSPLKRANPQQGRRTSNRPLKDRSESRLRRRKAAEAA